MYRSLIATLLLLSTAARAQEVVTICRATDLPGPYGAADQDVLIQVVPSQGLTRRQSALFLSSDGETEPDCAQGSSFKLIGGKLYTEGDSYSTAGDVPYELFTTAGASRGIDSIFGLTNGILFWDNPAFDTGTARFYLDSSNKLYVVYKGAAPAGWTPVALKTIPASTCTRRPSGSSNVPSTTPGPTGIPSPSTTPGPTNGTFTYNTPTLKPSNSTGPTATPDAVDQASLLILNNGLGRFCSEYLGYDKLATTTTEIGSEVTTVVTSLVDGTGPAVLVTVIRTETIDNFLTQTSTPTISEIVTQTNLATVVKGTTTIVQTDEIAYRSGLPEQRAPKVPNKLKERADEPAVSVPALLTAFAPDVISSACSENVVEPTNLPTQTVTSDILSTAISTVRGTGSGGLNTIYSNFTVQNNVTTYVSGRPFTLKGTATVTQTLNQTASVTSTVTVSTPSLLLANPTLVAGSLNGSDVELDGATYNITALNGTVQLYDRNSTELRVSLDGVISLDDYPGCEDNPQGSSYENVELPTEELDPATCVLTSLNGSDLLPAYSIAVFWDDLIVNEGSPGGLWYEEDDESISIEFLLQSFEDSNTTLHFVWRYDYNETGVHKAAYLTIDDGGESATIGVQGNYTTDYLQYSYNETSIPDGFFTLTIDTLANTFNSSEDTVPTSFKKST